jgi:hypothetical protein
MKKLFIFLLLLTSCGQIDIPEKFTFECETPIIMGYLRNQCKAEKAPDIEACANQKFVEFLEYAKATK